ncbi:hypothetical protein ABZS66_12170 [Dactylosporangium sp. NPDC005572]|uniref:hypothetical protein n=1 Tax=Dactylosporangium sp. NPDC005572 TaxID=3156889 RepID=UPI0033A6518B
MTSAHPRTPPEVPQPAGVRRAAAADATDITAVADVLATAFADTPLRVLLAGNRIARNAVLRRAFAGLAGWACVHGAVYLHATGAGAAIWLPAQQPPSGPPQYHPHRAPDGPDTADDAIDTALLELGAATADAPGLDTLASVLYPSAVLPEATAAPAYLIAVGADPDAQREGVARQLLDVHHQYLDATLGTAHALAIDPVGRRLLTATGYQPHRVDQPAAGLAVQWMRRPPHPGGQDGAAW